MDIEAIKLLLIKHEGFRLKPYVDSVGKLTIGVGHNLTDNGLTAKQVVSLFEDDIDTTLAFLSLECPWFKDLDAVRQVAIVDLAFNLGYKLLTFKNTVAAIEAKDWDTAADHLLNSLYAKQVGQRANDIAQILRSGEL